MMRRVFIATVLASQAPFGLASVSGPTVSEDITGAGSSMPTTPESETSGTVPSTPSSPDPTSSDTETLPSTGTTASTEGAPPTTSVPPTSSSTQDSPTSTDVGDEKIEGADDRTKVKNALVYCFDKYKDDSEYTQMSNVLKPKLIPDSSTPTPTTDTEATSAANAELAERLKKSAALVPATKGVGKYAEERIVSSSRMILVKYVEIKNDDMPGCNRDV